MELFWDYFSFLFIALRGNWFHGNILLVIMEAFFHMHVFCPGHHLARGHAKACGNTHRKWMVYETAFLGLAETDGNKIGLD